jgi:hypothetical protein
MSAVVHAVLAVAAKHAGDVDAAEEHLDCARRLSTAMARRERQLVELAALIVDDEWDRACDLSFEHGAQFADDRDLLAGLLGRHAPSTDTPEGNR